MPGHARPEGPGELRVIFGHRGYPRFQKVVASRDLVTDEGEQAGI